MSLLNILQFPDPRLKLVAEEVASITPEIQSMVTNMFETMYAAQGVGLAAIQVNIQKRIIVIDVSETRDQPLTLINPKITAQQGAINWEEGCLSFPGVYAKVKRAETISVSFLDSDGKEQVLEDVSGLLCICIQHEIDHLNGITFYDHLSPLKQSLMKKKLKKLREKNL